MQVSWIDEDELRALAARLQDAFPEAKAPQPANLDLAEISENLIASLLDAPDSHASPRRDRPVPAAPAPAPSSPPPPVQAVASDENLPEVAHIRERLKAIRDRAQEAGLLPPPPAVPEMPVPETVQAPEAPTWAPATESQASPNFSALAQAVASISEPDSAASLAIARAQNLVLPPDGTMAERLDSFTQWASRLTRAEQIILMDDYGDLLWGNPETNDLILTAMLALNASSRSRALGADTSPAFLRSQLGVERELYALPSNTRFGTVTLALINPTEVDADTTSRLQAGLVRSIEGNSLGAPA